MQRTFFRHPELAGALRNHAPQRSTESPPKVFSVENSFGCLAAFDRVARAFDLAGITNVGHPQWEWCTQKSLKVGHPP